MQDQDNAIKKFNTTAKMKITWLNLLLYTLKAAASDCKQGSRSSELPTNETWSSNWQRLSLKDYVRGLERGFPQSLQQQCMQSVPQSAELVQSELAECPWEVKLDFNKDRRPMILSYAKCKCHLCKNMRVAMCKPVLYCMPVMVKSCLNGRFVWQERIEVLPIACICEHARIPRVTRSKGMFQML